MKDCPSLSEVHPSIGDLKNLCLINFKKCTSLCNLPKETYQLISLKTLIISGCSKIEKLEEDIVQMESLTTLIAKDTSLKEVPYSILRLKSIGYISLCGYEGLTHDVFPYHIFPHLKTCPCLSLPWIQKVIIWVWSINRQRVTVVQNLEVFGYNAIQRCN